MGVYFCESRKPSPWAVSFRSPDGKRKLRYRKTKKEAEALHAEFILQEMKLRGTMIAGDWQNGIMCDGRADIPSKESLFFHRQPVCRKGQAIVYILWAVEFPLYVGKSRNGLARMAGHMDKPYDSITWMVVPKEKLERMERWCIEKLKPALNVTHNGCYTDDNPHIDELVSRGILKAEVVQPYQRTGCSDRMAQLMQEAIERLPRLLPVPVNSTEEASRIP